jgi:mono/diheme cytochrome c family protein
MDRLVGAQSNMMATRADTDRATPSLGNVSRRWTTLLVLPTLVLLAGCERTNRMDAGERSAAIERYCADCHNPAERAGDLSFDALDPAHVEAAPEVWEAAVRKLRAGMMPPLDAPLRPDARTADALVASLETALDETAVLDPGRPVLRRLNRAEYANAIRDLLDLTIDVSELLPPDDSAFGFDNIGDLLTVSPVLLERYLAAADRVSALAVGDPSTPLGSKTWIVPGDQSQTLHRVGLPLGTVGGLGVTHNFPLDAEYEFSLELVRNNLEGIRGLHHSHQIEIAVDGRRILLESVGAGHEPEMPRGTIITDRADATDARLRVRAAVPAGEHRVTAAFIRKIGAGTERLRPFDRSNADTYASDGRPHIESMTIAGPYDPADAGDTAARERIFSCRPATVMDEAVCAREILGRLARIAYRRPIDEDDLARLMPFFEEGRARGSFDAGIQFALRRIFASPSFVFRIEADREDLAAGEAYAVSDVELATRLSFFLWSSLPDAELLALAEAGRLSEPGVLAAEVRRMLADPKSDALAENFAAQWLHLRNLDTIRPNTDFYPDFDNNVRQAFKREAQLFFMSIVRENRSLVDLLTADYTFLDERLARHYGISGVYGSHFRRVTLGPDADERRGLLGKGGVLMATSHADRTAPSLRGKWLLENLLGSPPPPPPADVPGLEEVPAIAPQTMRERLDAHRANPACAGCHGLIDPLGFALENFDAVGGWRDIDAGRPVDALGGLADGTPVNGVVELREALVADPEAFAVTVTEKLMLYALGRGLQHYDMPIVRAILRDTAPDGYRFEAIVQGIVASPAFTMRSAAGGGR